MHELASRLHADHAAPDRDVAAAARGRACRLSLPSAFDTGRWPTRLQRRSRLAGARDRRASPSSTTCSPSSASGCVAEGLPLDPRDHAPAHPASAVPGRPGALAARNGGSRAQPDRARHASTIRAFVNSPVRALYEGAEGIRAAPRPAAERDGPGVRHLCRSARRGATPTMWRCRCSSPTASGTPPAGAPTGPAASPPPTWSRSTTSCRCWPLAVEIRANRRITKNLLNTYVGAARRRAHPVGRHSPRQRRHGPGRDLELRPARLHPDLRAVAARRRDPVAERVFRRHGRTGREAWRRDAEVRRRRHAGDLPASTARKPATRRCRQRSRRAAA